MIRNLGDVLTFLVEPGLVSFLLGKALGFNILLVLVVLLFTDGQ